MSLVIAIKDKNRVVFGSDKQTSTGANKSHDTTKIWEVKELPGAIMGGVGSMRANQVIQYSKVIDLNDVSDHGGIDIDFIINSLVPVIVGQLKLQGISCGSQEDKDMPCTMIPNTFLFAYKDKAWMIWHDLSVSELDDYLAIGSGSDVANGALFATPDKNPFERIVTSIDAAAETTLYVDDGVDLLATDYEEGDAELMATALGAEEEFKQYVAELKAALQEDGLTKTKMTAEEINQEADAIQTKENKVKKQKSKTKIIKKAD